MQRNYTQINKYLDLLEKDIYCQPPDPGHTRWATAAINSMCKGLDVSSVLDVGCGSGFTRPIFTLMGYYWEGIDKEGNMNENIREGDISFLPYGNNSFDLIFARHILEHSPMPLLTLMEWRRVSKEFLIVILPAPEYWTIKGKNHYYVLPKENWDALFEASGWKKIMYCVLSTYEKDFMDFYMPDVPRDEVEWKGKHMIVEYRYLLRKIK